MSISKIHARTVYDSRWNPTVEVEITTENGIFRSIVPSGTSTGSKEAVELRDGDMTKWLGKGVTKAVANVNDVIRPVCAKSFSEASRIGSETYHHLKSLAKKKYGASASNVGDKCGVAPNIDTPKEVLDLIVTAIKEAGHYGKIKIAIDSAPSVFYKNGKYDLDCKNPNSKSEAHLNSAELGQMYQSLLKKYPLISLEYPFSEDDWAAWRKVIKDCPVQVIADDITCTNSTIIKKAIQDSIADTLLLKVNQIGTLTESLLAASEAFEADWGVMLSHR